MEELRFVLASGSPRRKELLERAGFRPVVIPSGKDENITRETPAALVKALSRLKADDVAAAEAPGTVVLGADTIVCLNGSVLGKPKDEEEAFTMLKALAGGTHHVYTGVTIIRVGGARVTFAEKTAVSVYPMTDEEIHAYIATGDPLDKAGAYGIQGPFGAYIRRLSGDYTNVVGLPLGRTVYEFKKLIREGSREV